MTIRIGISGWRYARWRGTFYPAGLAQRRELKYAELLDAFLSSCRATARRHWRRRANATSR